MYFIFMMKINNINTKYQHPTLDKCINIYQPIEIEPNSFVVQKKKIIMGLEKMFF